MVCGKKRLFTGEKFKGDLYWKQCWYHSATEFCRCFCLHITEYEQIRGGRGAKFSWAQGRKIPKYGPDFSTWTVPGSHTVTLNWNVCLMMVACNRNMQQTLHYWIHRCVFDWTTFYFVLDLLHAYTQTYLRTFSYYSEFGKGKAVPLQAWSGAEGSRKLRFPDYVTVAQDGGKVVSLTHRPPLPSGNAPGTHFC